MNERIREILTQCQQESIDGPEYPHWTDFEKFAELIVRECVRYFNEEYERDFATSWREDLSKGMKEHFGVKE